MPLPKLPTRLASILNLNETENAVAKPARPLGNQPANRLKGSAHAAGQSALTDITTEAIDDHTLSTSLPFSSTTNAPSSLSSPQSEKKLTPNKEPLTKQKPSSSDSPIQSSNMQTTSAQARRRSKSSDTSSKSGASGRKLFVLDTNVLLHDPSSLFRFEEHDVYLPMMTLEELDHQKKGMSEVARNARQVSRSLDALVQDSDHLDQGVLLSHLGNKDAKGKLFFQASAISNALPPDLPIGIADNQILAVVKSLQDKLAPREVVLVSKDINMRLKARMLGLEAEDYFNDHVLEDSDLLYNGMLALPDNFWTRHSKDIESWQQGGTTFYRINGPLCSQFLVNQFVYFEGSMPLYAQVREVNGKTAVLATLRDYSHAKNNVWGVVARNREQNFAMNLLLNPDCDFVTLLGQAGTGKTLIALAAGLTQVLETKRYSEIIITRVTVSVGEDIGFLPGTEEEKMLPWMGALEDNLDVLNMGDGDGSNEWGRASTMELIRSRIKVKSLNFMRGRTFLNKYLIIDEAQNLTPKQMKTLVTRAGPGTKVVCLGNIAQIDTPYLTEGSSGLTFVVDRFKGWPHSGHVTLQRGERSRLADYAGEVL
jgi:PhoH-like ATPase